MNTYQAKNMMILCSGAGCENEVCLLRKDTDPDYDSFSESSVDQVENNMEETVMLIWLW